MDAKTISPEDYAILEDIAAREARVQTALARIAYALYKLRRDEQQLCRELDSIALEYKKFQDGVREDYDIEGQFSIQPDGTIQC